MGYCDLCNATLGGETKRYSASQMRAAVGNGLRPDGATAALATALGQDVSQGWVNKVMTDTTDWGFCPACAQRVDAALNRPGGTEPGASTAEALAPASAQSRLPTEDEARADILEKLAAWDPSDQTSDLFGGRDADLENRIVAMAQSSHSLRRQLRKIVKCDAEQTRRLMVAAVQSLSHPEILDRESLRWAGITLGLCRAAAKMLSLVHTKEDIENITTWLSNNPRRLQTLIPQRRWWQLLG